MKKTEDSVSTLVEMTRAQLFRLAGLTPTPEDLLDEEFLHLMGREPDADDRALGVQKVVQFWRALQSA